MQTGFRDKLRMAGDYLRFRLDARSRYTIHSPFLFELVNDVFRDKRHFYAFDEIEKARQRLLADDTIIHENHFGENSKKLPSTGRTISDIVRTTALPDHYGRLLFRLVNQLQPASILELGTATGISTLYLASAAASVPVVTLEGSPELSKKAKEQFGMVNLNNAKIITGNFNETLPGALRELKNPAFIFIDGDHRKKPLINYVKQCLEVISTNSTIVIDDIYWSEEMKEAWMEIIHLPQITMSIDLFRMGVLFLREGMVKQHLKVAYGY